MSRKVALVTGASRGIGKACAIELATAGFDVAILARTVRDGERREHSSTVARSDTSPLPGSLAATAAAIEAQGVRALPLAADLTDVAAVEAAVRTALDRWGRIDAVVHNGRYVGPGHMDAILDTPLDLVRRQMEANFFAALAIDAIVLPGMIERGRGTIVTITSSAGFEDPPAPAGRGGWGLGYGASKAALHRVAGFLHVELADRGIRSFNVQPGFVATERMAQDMHAFGFAADGASPAVPAAVVRWLCTDPGAAALAGTTIAAQPFCRERGLLA